jgi:hypothetical protein
MFQPRDTAMNPVTAESLNVEAWIEQHATHTCPHWGGRFNPAQCGGRKTKALKLAKDSRPGWDWARNVAGYDLSKCLECDGPIPIHEGTKMKPAKELSEVSEFPIRAAKQETVSDDKVEKYTYRCKNCGKVGSENFYASVRNYCKACCRARDKERHAARPKKYALIVEQQKPAEPAEKPVPVPAILTPEPAICPVCNKPHNGFLINGRGVSRTCKECIIAKRNATWQRNRAKHKRSCYAMAADTVPPAEAEAKSVTPQPEQTETGIDIAASSAALFNLHEERDRKLLLKLQVLAALEHRTLEQQIVYLVEVALRGMESEQ